MRLKTAIVMQFKLHPLRNRYFTAISSSSIRTVADRHRLAAYHNKHCWRPFQGYQHR